ncbi:MAG: serine/threonine protein kinase [Candidatus Eisenbacteria sp.]|nr:serine/threonine protein kinase [Candidatus Eisenbacteria bacterium]
MALSAEHLRDLEQRVGEALGKEYESVELFRVGGMAVIFTGVNRRLGRKEAIKVFPALEGDDCRSLEGFEQECRALAALKHPNVITIFSAGHSEKHGLAWLAEEFIEGETLAEKLRYGPLGLTEGLAIARGVLAGLEHAHGRGILHRDLKPENVFLEADGRVILADFGIALISGPRRFQGVRPAGTVAYMSPEQIRGDELDVRSDLYSYGLLLYELFTGRHPFQSPDREVVAHRQVHESPRGPKAIQPDLPDELCELILDLLKKDRDSRPRSAGDVRERLARIQVGETGSEATGLATSRGGGRSRTVRRTALVTIAVGVAAVLIVWLRPWEEPNRSEGPPVVPDTLLPIVDPGSLDQGKGTGGNGIPVPIPDRVDTGPFYVRIVITGDREAAQGSLIFVDDEEQEFRAPTVLFIEEGDDTLRIALQRHGIDFTPSEHWVEPRPAGDTTDVTFKATTTVP